MRMFHENSRCCYILGNFSGIICFADLLHETLPSVTYQNFLAIFVAATVGISKTKRDTLGMLHKAMSRETCATNVRDKLLGKLPCVLTATLSSMDICSTKHFHKYAIW